MKKTVLYIAFCFISLWSFGQSKDIRHGDDAYKEKTYSIAREYYSKTLDAARSSGDNNTAAYASYKIAECYYQANIYDRAIPFYRQAISLNYQDTSKTMYRNYGDMLMMIGD